MKVKYTVQVKKRHRKMARRATVVLRAVSKAEENKSLKEWCNAFYWALSSKK
ncbi:hypothetical protein [Xanthomonas phage XAJ2]|uniref:Uncharacterized protein n=1 Tax=Xanthomonas phage XAJ2 TaxID=1775249 RepID=A0A1I9L2H5_9CAUD|nr:hypothetical protein [Xanthomonas phage XAJ2]